jgi:hypothetical protein
VDRTQSSAAYASFSTASELQLGQMLNNSSRFHGTIDEARVENQIRGSNWIWASYLTMASNASFTVPSAIARQVPQLSLSRSETNSVFSWLGPAVGFRLYSATNLGAPVWLPITNSCIYSNQSWSVGLPGDGAPARYYLLKSD